MTNIRRYFRRGDISFTTHVTYERRPVLVDNFDLLCQAWHSMHSKSGLCLIAWVVLPDHLHLLIDQQKCDLPGLIKKFKLSFSYHYRERLHLPKGRVWQYRFWDHIIRNQEDLNRHIDYIHYNPVKHGMTGDIRRYRYSSFHDYCERGYYEDDWGRGETIEFDGEFGE